MPSTILSAPATKTVVVSPDVIVEMALEVKRFTPSVDPAIFPSEDAVLLADVAALDEMIRAAIAV